MKRFDVPSEHSPLYEPRQLTTLMAMIGEFMGMIVDITPEEEILHVHVKGIFHL
jgi:hypothetical protein